MKNYTNFIKKFMLENKRYIYLSFIFLFISILILIFTPIEEWIKNILLNDAKQYILAHFSENKFQLAWNIFVNNTFVWFIILLSWFFMSILGILAIFWNVLIMFIIVPLSVEKVWLLKTILALAPHGFTEIFAVLLSLTLAFKITHLLFKKVWNWKENKVVPYLKEVFIFWLIFVLPLFLLSAIIEAFITPLFL